MNLKIHSCRLIGKVIYIIHINLIRSKERAVTRYHYIVKYYLKITMNKNYVIILKSWTYT